MNDEPRFVLAFQHFGNDLVEGNNFRRNVGGKQLEHQVRCRHGSRHRDLELLEFVQRNAASGDDHGAVAFANAAAGGHDRVLVLNIRIGVKGYRGDVVKAVQGLAIQGLDIAKGVSELHVGNANFAGRHPIEHESVVRVGTVRDGDFAGAFTGSMGHKSAAAQVLPKSKITGCGKSRQMTQRLQAVLQFE